jgi:hypothetical protein
MSRVVETALEADGRTETADTRRSNQAQIGQASFGVTPAQNRPGWGIVQLHSSTAR